MNSHNFSKSDCQFYLFWKYGKELKQCCVREFTQFFKDSLSVLPYLKYRKELKQHCISVSLLKFEAFTAVVTLIRGGVPSVQSLLQFTQLYGYTQHTFISAVSLLKFDALTRVVTLIKGGVPPFKIFVLQLFNDKFRKLMQSA